MLSRKILFGTVVLVLVFCEISSLDVQFERLELLNASYVEDKYNISLLRVSRINRTTYSLNIEFEFFRDLGTDFSLEVLFYFNRFNNNQYNRHPLAIPKMGFCDAMEKYYKILKGFFKLYSNFPQFKEGEPACPFPKGKYWMKDAIAHPSFFDPSTGLVVEGYWRGEAIIYYRDEVMLILRVYCKFSGILDGIIG